MVVINSTQYSHEARGRGGTSIIGGWACSVGKGTAAALRQFTIIALLESHSKVIDSKYCLLFIVSFLLVKHLF